MRAYMVDVIAVEDDEGTTTKYWTTDGAYLGADESGKRWEELSGLAHKVTVGAEPAMESSMPTFAEYEPDDGPAAIRKRLRWLQTIAAVSPVRNEEISRLERALKELQS